MHKMKVFFFRHIWALRFYFAMLCIFRFLKKRNWICSRLSLQVHHMLQHKIHVCCFHLLFNCWRLAYLLILICFRAFFFFIERCDAMISFQHLLLLWVNCIPHTMALFVIASLSSDSLKSQLPWKSAGHRICWHEKLGFWQPDFWL